MIKLALILVIAPFICIDGYTVQPRIINGNLTNPEGVPWFAHININDFNCGATLISDRYLSSKWCRLARNTDRNTIKTERLFYIDSI